MPWPCTHAWVQTNLAKHVWKCNLCGNVNIDQNALPSMDPLVSTAAVREI